VQVVVHVAGIAIYSRVDVDELTASFFAGDPALSALWAREVSHVLRRAAPEDRARLWHDRLDGHWARRQAGIPRALGEDELAAMMAWVPLLGTVFDSVVARVCAGARVPSDGGLFYAQLVEARLAETHGLGVLTLLLHALTGERSDLLSCSAPTQLVRQLREVGIPLGKLRAVCEELERLRCNGVRLWRDLGGDELRE
jgi:hypothetical protein